MQLGTQFAKYLQDLLKEFSVNQVTIWSDSEAALQWIRNNNSKIPYVQNRVATIQELGSSFQFLHIPTKENPADLVTRGISVKQFRKATMWINGPLWLPYPEQWPIQKQHVVVSEIVSEVTPVLPCIEPLFESTKYSTLNRLLSVTKYVFCFIKGCKPTTSFPEPLAYWIQQV